ncbi:hypothetical protein [Natronococcus jeotgali]|uniref:Uncharacterized protein n=1 Tax=Natronococcus jeotgali DSM 18795 TaxID=1227498 RepID=L9Y0R3_9EURY|nr:hypothetical protein [Natronococcus jeotgali]ELY66448.1 hypothetical protein C492_00949 [Natronococcus jeotgali DSM 18795]
MDLVGERVVLERAVVVREHDHPLGVRDAVDHRFGVLVTGRVLVRRVVGIPGRRVVVAVRIVRPFAAPIARLPRPLRHLRFFPLVACEDVPAQRPPAGDPGQERSSIHVRSDSVTEIQYTAATLP